MAIQKLKKIYLSMPITGYDIDERMERVSHIKRLFSDLYIVSPFDASPYDPEKSYEACMKDCIKELLTCDEIWFDYGWYDSNGCRIEAEVARGCGIKRHFITELSRLASAPYKG